MHEKQESLNLTILNEELENYFRNTLIPQLFVDAHLILRKFTPPAMKQFDLSRSDIGRSIMDVTENFRFPGLIENIESVINSGEILQKEIQTTDFRWYQMDILPYITRKNNKPNGVIITFVEITDRIKDLHDLEKLIADHELILDTISHDFKTPLTSLILAIEIFNPLDPGSVEQYQTFYTIVKNSSTKMERMIRELTESRKQDHRYQAQEELLSLENIVEDVRLTLADAIKQTGAIIKTEFHHSEITFSRRKLRSVLYNILSNALKYMPADRKPEILIKSECQNDYMVISIKDNGVGIDKAHQEKIFLKYTRLASNVEGTGVGLYLIKEIVQSSGGKIELESEPGIGSVFKVYLKLSGSNNI